MRAQALTRVVKFHLRNCEEIEHELFTGTRKTQRSSWTALANHKEGGEDSYVFLLI